MTDNDAPEIEVPRTSVEGKANEKLLAEYPPSSGGVSGNNNDNTFTAFAFNSTESAVEHLPKFAELNLNNGETAEITDAQDEPRTERGVIADLNTLTSDKSRGRDVDEAEYRLVREASSLYGSKSDSRLIIRTLGEIVNDAGTTPIDGRPTDPDAREAREARACLQKIFSNLSGNGRNLDNKEARDRIRLMPSIADGPLRNLVQANPVSADTTNPNGKEIRENAQALLGEIQADKTLERIRKAHYANDPEPVEPLWRDLINSAKDTSTATGLGITKQIREWTDSWKPQTDQYKEGEKALAEISRALTADTDNLNNADIRARLRAAGPAASDALQTVIKDNPPTQDSTVPQSRIRREHARDVLNHIGKDLTAADLGKVRTLANLDPDNDLSEITKRIETRASSTNNPLSLSTAQTLRDLIDDWKPATNEYKVGERLARSIASQMLRNGQALNNTQVQESVRALGRHAIPALELIITQNGAGVEKARDLIATIRSDKTSRQQAFEALQRK